jgi:hypothetical protein
MLITIVPSVLWCASGLPADVPAHHAARLLRHEPGESSSAIRPAVRPVGAQAGNGGGNGNAGGNGNGNAGGNGNGNAGGNGNGNGATTYPTTTTAGPFSWARWLLDPASVGSGDVAYDPTVYESIAARSGATAQGGILDTLQWSGTDSTGAARSFAGNTLIGPAHGRYWIGVPAWDVQRGTLSGGTWSYARHTQQHWRLYLGYAAADRAGLAQAHGAALRLGAAFPADAIVLSLPMGWVSGGSSAWQNGDYNGNPPQTGVWYVPAGQTMAQAQAADANRLGDLAAMLAGTAPSAAGWRVDLDVQAGAWTVRLDRDGDGVADAVRSSGDSGSLPGPAAVGTRSGLITWLEAAGGVALPMVGTTTAALAYQEVVTPGIPGLSGIYHRLDSGDAAIERVDARIDFDWRRAAPATALPADRFGAVWIGTVIPRFSEDYTFIARTDDGVRVWIDDALVLDRWVNKSASEVASASVRLTANQPARIRVEYYENTGNASARLSWRSASEAQAVIPQDRLRTADALNAFAPVIAGPASGTGAVTMALATALDGGVIRYTTDGSTPTAASPAVSGGQLTLTASANLRAAVFGADGSVSPVAARAVTVIPLVAGPTGVLASYIPGTNPGAPAALSRTDSAISFAWGAAAPATGLPADRFTVRWEGELIPAWSEDTTISVSADDGARVYLDGKLIIDRFQGTGATSAVVPLTAGVALPLRVEYVELTGSATMRLRWQSASLPLQNIPTGALRAVAAPAPDGAGTGLAASVFAGTALAGSPLATRTDPRVDWRWGADAPAAGAPADGWSMRWSGAIVPRFSEPYTLSVVADDGVRVFVDGVQVIADWRARGTRTLTSAPIALTAGRTHAITVEKSDVSGNAGISLHWQSASQAREVVPAWRLQPSLPPVAQPLAVSGQEDQPIAGAPVVSDPDSPSLAWTLAAAPAHGSLVFDAATGAFTYTPAADWSGSDAFTLSVSDGVTAVPLPVSVQVAPVDDPAVVTLTGSQAVEGGILRLTATRDRSEGELVLPLLVAGQLRAGRDVAAWPASLVIPAGASEASVDISVLDDDIREFEEVATVAAGPHPLVLSATPATLRVADDGDPIWLIDDGEPGYSETGVWWTSVVSGWLGTPTRYGESADARADYAFPLDLSGWFRVEYYANPDANSDAQTGIRMASDLGTWERTLDLRTAASGWTDLGTLRLAPGTATVSVVRQGGSGPLRADAIRLVPVSAPGATQEIDRGHIGYAESGGAWWTSVLPSPNGGSSRYSFDPTAVATWRPVLHPGLYRVRFWNTVDPWSASAVRVEVAHALGTSSVQLSQITGTSGWVDLGVLPLLAGQGAVTLRSLSGDGPLRADAVRFEAQPLDSITIATTDPSYREVAGAWWSSAFTTGHAGGPTRYSNDAASAVARWFAPPAEGLYRLEVYRVVNATNGGVAALSVTDADGAESLGQLSQKAPAVSGWVDLGLIRLAPTGVWPVEIRAVPATGTPLRADAVRLTLVTAPAGPG